MTLTPTQARAIARGHQTTLRLPAKPGRAGAPWTACPWTTDREYAIPQPLTDQQRHQIRNGDLAPPPPLGHVRVASAVREPLFITLEQARTEGHTSIDAFRHAWVRTYDKAWTERHTQGVTARGTLSDLLLDRYRTRWEGRTVWVVSFELVAGIRYLAQPDPVAGQGDYTMTPSRSIDPLPVVEAAVVEKYAKDALAFCLGRQVARAREQEARRHERARQSRMAA